MQRVFRKALTGFYLRYTGDNENRLAQSYISEIKQTQRDKNN